MRSTPRRAVAILVFALMTPIHGCRWSRSVDRDFGALVKPISYKVEPAPPPPSEPEATSEAQASSERGTAVKVASTIGAVLLWIPIKIMQNVFDNDDKGYKQNKRDRNFNAWLDQRDKWRREAKSGR